MFVMRALLIVLGVLILPNLALLFSGYGIRIEERPCTHYIGFVTVTNYLTKACPKFGRWKLAMTPPALH